MTRISYKRHRFPPAVIQHAVWLYFRFTLSLRDVEEMLAHRGIDVSYETIRYWTVKFGAKIASNLRRRKLPPSPRCTWTRWSPPLQVNACGSGAQSTTRARCWT